MRVLVTGGGGLLGGQLLRGAPGGLELSATVRGRPLPEGVDARAFAVELSDPDATARVIAEARPDVVVHTAYGTADLDRDILRATSVVAGAAAAAGARLLHVSSDVVFDGEHAPYAEDDAPAPVHAYGRAKARAEQIVRERCPDAAIVRTSLIVRLDPPDPVTAWLIDGLRHQQPVTLYDDEWRCPILVEDLAAMIWEIVGLPTAHWQGIWHLLGPEALTRAQLGRRLVRRLGLDESKLVEVPSPPPASAEEGRPRDLRLSAGRANAHLLHRPSRI